MATSVYIHIPFCKTKCKYCSFVSYENAENFEEYVKALLKEIKYYYRGETLNTIYFGGGTPSLLPTKYVKKILEKFIYIPEFCEITYEMNPDDVDLNYLKELHALGINRISLGAQTFNGNILAEIGRRHTSEQILKAVKLIQKAGFKNISLDLIYGLPNQTEDILSHDLDVLTQLNIQHISTYGLKIEEPSFFFTNTPKNIPSDDTQADMYRLINDTLNDKEFYRYEISNFARKGFESKHNLNYWNNKEYYGFGTAAHGYTHGIRYSNRTSLEDYIRHPLKRASEHYVTPKEKFEEAIFLGFRREKGININYLKDKYFVDFEKKYKDILDKYVPEFIEKTDVGYKLTQKGVLLSNNILADFIE